MNKPKKHSIFSSALKYSLPVFFGYIAIGTAFGLVMADAGYPWWLSLVMSIVMFAGAGQFIAVGLFAAGTGILEAVLIQFVVNARHIAYSMSMISRFKKAGIYKLYLIFGLTDETFALLSSLPEPQPGSKYGEGSPLEKKEPEEKERSKFMFYVTALNQCYWIAGTLTGAVAGSLIPFNTEGIGFALTALFIVLMLDKLLAEYKTNKNYSLFIISAAAAVLTVFFLPARISILAAMAVSLALSPAANRLKARERL